MQFISVERKEFTLGSSSSGVKSLSMQDTLGAALMDQYLSTISSFFRSLYKALFTFTNLKILPFLYSHRLLMQYKAIGQLWCIEHIQQKDVMPSTTFLFTSANRGTPSQKAERGCWRRKAVYLSWQRLKELCQELPSHVITSTRLTLLVLQLVGGFKSLLSLRLCPFSVKQPSPGSTITSKPWNAL